MTGIVVSIHLVATFYMLGLIWLVQIVHYPLLAKVGKEYFIAYEQAHTQWITPVVAIPMFAELFTGLFLLADKPAWLPQWANILSILLIAAVWLSTIFIQVPLHNQLLNGFNQAAHFWLVTTNWIRTAAWTLRSILWLYLILQYIKFE
jgi:hypothetical protein